ncbi:hypothetical protein [Chryseobacterium sp. 22543]|uniref:hypothetical protein n=1 Tax=Chryseobacterium sp. 22543 TaxID=3453940 RepID=UPI003DF16E6C
MKPFRKRVNKITKDPEHRSGSFYFCQRSISPVVYGWEILRHGSELLSIYFNGR